MKVSLIAAVARNGVIGIENRLPWHLPEDLAYFKQTTLGCPVLMGRKTYESINRPLPGRLNVVLTQQTDWAPAPAKDGSPRAVIHPPQALPAGGETAIAVASTLEQALAWLAPFDQVFLIGGSNLYAQAVEQGWVDTLLLTEIHADFAGDAQFPAWPKSRFHETHRIHNPPAGERPWGFDFVTYEKTAAPL
ncbi:dihydrofolate reductase [Limnobacter humi]|uniref:Dihydrofolate reductase n=1 Tax=Limnobacter humi TaxID=1778671 RepID=A0ABT1WJB1_9BURK|nr:dihydrofolate reductase [Limnobacter humi]MCQ8897126.1 dihydrofolate reductase [Limnobacter humi]